MSIAGVLIHAYPGSTNAVRSALEGLNGVEIHRETDDGRYIVTVEDTETTRLDDTILALQQLSGVASVALAYHSFEPEEANSSAELAAKPASHTGGV